MGSLKICNFLSLVVIDKINQYFDAKIVELQLTVGGGDTADIQFIGYNFWGKFGVGIEDSFIVLILSFLDGLFEFIGIVEHEGIFIFEGFEGVRKTVVFIDFIGLFH